MVDDGDAAGLGELALLYQQRQQRDRAQATFDAAFKLEPRGIAPPRLIALLNAYAVFCLENSQFAPAQAALARALALGESTAGATSPAILDTLDQLGFVYEATQRYAEAAALFERSLAIRRAHQLDIVTPLTHLGHVAAAQDRYQEAEQDYRAVRTYLYAAYPPGDRAFASNDAHLAALYTLQGNHAAALDLLVDAVRVEEAQANADEAELVEMLSALGTAYYKLDRIDEAAQTEARALAVASKRFGPSHHRVATALNDLGVMESERHHLDRAETLMQQALAMRETLLGPDHPDCAISLGGLAAVAMERGQPAVAEAYLLRSLAINEAAMGRSHSDVASDLMRLANVYIEQENYGKAEPVLVRAWAIRRDGPMSLGQKRLTAQRLARVYRKLAREPDALVLDTWLAANDGGHN